ncbi:MAG: ABC transporter ATP-binding protein [Rhodospirillaceae bacterium]|nr:ABC transporter ATP-binding protein [Rhodospirillaceae bacterium]
MSLALAKPAARPREMPTAAVVAENVRLSVANAPDILAGIDLEIRDGEFVAIVGPSGCGKTTFLNTVAGLQPFTSGSLTVVGDKPKAGRRETAYALARDALLPWRDALGNVELALQIRGVPPEERRRRAAEALAKVGLADALTRHPAQLSQGMRQRVALARTFVTEPRLLILDEPFAALDAQTRIRMQELLLALLRQFSGTMIMVTHDIAEAITLADRVVVFSQRPATVTAVYEVKLGNRKRKTSELRADPEFSRLFEQVWRDIEQGFEP